jgi:hypothetical protein
MTFDPPGWIEGTLPANEVSVALLIIVVGVFMMRRRPQRPKQKRKA